MNPRKPPKCECGCGKRVSSQTNGVWSRWLPGHSTRRLVVSSYRRNVNRCDSVKHEDNGKPRSWRCQLVAGHPGFHTSFSGHRTWGEPSSDLGQEQLTFFAYDDEEE